MATEATDQLRQLEQDKAKYEAELEALTKAMPVEVACKELAVAILHQEEPLDAEHKKDNPWTSRDDPVGCCTVM